MASAGNPNFPRGGGAPRPGFNMFPGQQMAQQGMMGTPTHQGMMGVGPMPQGMMGVPQGMMGQAVPGQMAAPMHGMAPGFRGSPVPGMAPQFGGMPQQFGVPVSGGYAYSPEMQKNYAEQQKKFAEQQQKMMEEQKKREEKERKERQFQEQKRRLGAMRTASMGKGGANFDSMFGRAVQGFALDVTKGSPSPKAQVTSPSMPASTSDFGGPAPGLTPPSHGAPLPAAAMTPPTNTGDDDFGAFLGGPAQGQPQGQPQGGGPPVQITSVVEPVGHASLPQDIGPQGPNLQSMMLESCDLTGPDKPKKAFQKAAPPRMPTINKTATPSQKARDWNASSFSGIFTVESPQAPQMAEAQLGSPAVAAPVTAQSPTLPLWCQNDAAVPEAYRKVVESVTTEAGLETRLLYPILVSSSLPKEVLGQLWAMANRTVPGTLMREELYLILGLIAVAQTGAGPLTLEFLHTVQQPPVPKLDENLLVPPKGRSSSFGPQGMLGGPPAVPMPPGTMGTVPPVSQSALGKTDQLQGMMGGDDDFADFQEAPRPSSGSFGDFTTGVSVPALPQGVLRPSGSASPSPSVSSVGSSNQGDKYVVCKPPTEDSQSSGSTDTSSDYPDKYGAIRAYMGSDSQDSASLSSHGSGFNTGLAAHSTGGLTEGDDFADFKSASEAAPPPAPVPAFLKSLSTHHNKALPDLAGFEDENIAAAPPTLPSKPSVPTPPLSSDIFNIRKKSFNDFADFKSADSNVWEKQDGGNADKFGDFASTSDLKKSSSGQKLTESLSGFADFVQSGKSTPPGDGNFADFQQSSDLMGGDDNASDKYSVFKDISEDTQSLTSIGSTDASKDSDKYGIFRELGSWEGQPPEDLFGSLSSAESKKTGGSEKDTQSVRSLELPAMTSTEATSKDEEFGNFSSISVAQPPILGKDTGLFNSQATKATGEFSAFASLGSTAAPLTGSDKYDMFKEQSSGQGTESKNEFGDFSWSSSSKQSPFGDFKGPVTSTGGDLGSLTSSSVNQTFGGFAEPVQSNTPVFGQQPANISHPESKLPDWSMGISQSGGSETSLPSSLFDSIQTDKKSVQIRDLTDLSDLKSANKTVPREDEFGDFNSAAEKTGGGQGDFGDFSTAESGPGPSVGSKEGGKYAGAVVLASSVPTKPVADSSPLYIRDRYSGMSSTVEDNERHEYEWKRCLESCLKEIRNANNIFNDISSSSVCNEVIKSVQGSDYIRGVIEIYRVVCRITVGMRSASCGTADLHQLLKEIDLVWNNLSAFLTSSPIMPEPGSLDFSTGALKPGISDAQLACGVCLLSVDSRSKAFDRQDDCNKLNYGGRQYHAPCANFWVNRVNSTLPALPLRELL
ncbi:synergin gamma-like isoform X2 [Branchiostoma lanceolatum]|uniref:synergin gamma-like isoform X2 n=1 Tax=Branchiostoma lanceolatum TaxID=7740 RepID=UPI003453A818